jgi:hypothetical protein
MWKKAKRIIVIQKKRIEKIDNSARIAELRRLIKEKREENSNIKEENIELQEYSMDGLELANGI